MVRNHQYVYKKINAVKEGVEGIAFAYNGVVSIFICISIYSITQKENLFFRIPEGLNASFLIYFFHNEAERIKTESKRLAMSVYDIPWIDKPKWFKKYLLIIMTRCSNPVEIKLFGLSELSLKNFAVILNAAYSYYNVLNSLKNKTN
ncbi:odorant receptor 43a-like [Lycorma delicatula]|uniref:odorant receptor 43a-like n=1 Tax=Lycorma delicatula TaxID=130591 RepID=UPI003F5100D2